MIRTRLSTDAAAPSSRLPQILAGVGAGLFIVSRVLIEVMRIGSASQEDAAFGLTLVWSTSLTLVLTLGALLGFLYAGVTRAKVRRDALLKDPAGLWCFEVDRLRPLQRELRKAGAPPEVTRFFALSMSFSVLATSDGLGLWTGTDNPVRSWFIPRENMVGISAVEIPAGIYSWPGIRVEVAESESVIAFDMSLGVPATFMNSRPTRREIDEAITKFVDGSVRHD